MKVLGAIASGIKRFATGYLLAILIGIAAAAALAVTTRMNQMAGIAQGASEEGQFLLGWGAIIVHVAGVVLCGLVAGSAAKRGHRKLTAVMSAIVIASAIFSMMSIMGFMELEALSVNQTRAAKIEQRAKNAEASRQAAAERLRLQAELAKEQLKYNRIETQGRIGRAERKELRRDMAEASRNLIADVGKEAAAPKERIDDTVLMAPASGSVLISKLTFGLLQPTDAQSFRLGYMTVLLLVLEVVLWWTAGYSWGGFAPVSAIDAAPVVLPLTPPPQEVAGVRDQGSGEKAILLTPDPYPLKPILRAEPSPEWRSLLDAIGVPRKKPMGQLRPKDDRSVAGWRWFVWIGARNRLGNFTSDQLDELYLEFLSEDHREKWGEKAIKGLLREAAGTFIKHRGNVAPALWTISAPTPQRMRAMLIQKKILPKTEIKPADDARAPEVAPEQQEAGDAAAGPFVSQGSGALAQRSEAANENAPKKQGSGARGRVSKFALTPETWNLKPLLAQVIESRQQKAMLRREAHRAARRFNLPKREARSNRVAQRRAA